MTLPWSSFQSCHNHHSGTSQPCASRKESFFSPSAGGDREPRGLIYSHWLIPLSAGARRHTFSIAKITRGLKARGEKEMERDCDVPQGEKYKSGSPQSLKQKETGNKRHLTDSHMTSSNFIHIYNIHHRHVAPGLDSTDTCTLIHGISNLRDHTECKLWIMRQPWAQRKFSKMCVKSVDAEQTAVKIFRSTWHAVQVIHQDNVWFCSYWH